MASIEKPDLANYRGRMDKAVVALKEEFATLRTGRASAGLLDQVHVEAYGSRMPISQVGSVSVPEARSITVSVWDKGLVVSVEKAIRNAGLGLNPVVEGQNLRIPIPPLTEERRRDLAKLAGKYAEQQKVAVRNVRREAMDDLRKAEKEAVITQDEHKRLESDVQKITDEAVGRVDDTLNIKEQEIMQV
ncbi:MAG: ribosome recycling factor [Caulobacteraceae bacterium]